MSKQLILILLLSGFILLLNGSITRIEYFFDTDPGLGYGTSLAFSGSTEAHVSADISATNLTNGLHFLYIRAVDNLGKWSLLNCKPFIKESTASANITRLEYFFDTDPGAGNGTAIPITPAGEVIYADDLTLSEVSNGLHFFFLRAQNSLGYWSLMSSKMILITSDIVPDLARAEWYFKGGDADPNTIYSLILPELTTDITGQLSLSISQLTQDQDYQLHFYMVSVDGKKSLEQIMDFHCNFTPQNVTLVVNGEAANLSWSDIPGTAYYKLSLKDAPLETGTVYNLTDTEYTGTSLEHSQMYSITAVEATKGNKDAELKIESGK
jgi:hypothetical protein